MKTSIIAPVLLATMTLAACSAEPDATNEAGAEVQATLLEVLQQTDAASSVADAMGAAGLDSVLEEATGSYTILAPEDGVFEPLTEEGSTPTALLASILREHMLPGQLDIPAIKAAIESNGGPVSVATVGTGTLQFALDGDALTVTHSESGRSAKLSDEAGQAQNGALLLLDSVLVVPPTEES